MCKIAAVTMVKDEEDIIYNSILHMAEEGVDVIIVADNMSTDKTALELQKAVDVLHGGSCELLIVEDSEKAYYQSDKMTGLAHLARTRYGAEWIIPFDADELWYHPAGKVGDILRSYSDDVHVVLADLYNYFPGALDGVGNNPFQTMVWRQRERGALPKVAVRYHHDMVIEMGNHGVRLPFQYKAITGMQIGHFPYRSWAQFLRKVKNGAAAYKLTNLDKQYGAHWRGYQETIDRWGEDVLRKEVFEKYFWFFSPIDNGMINSPAPFRRWNKQS